ncbi:hypothetical protein HRR83_007066 [Exophiala dermatitidis]|uniref:15-hydroxyprostaglandin dehydrogenase (NAD) n=2 Tax=Exophiala dermatitidis TaxID=5970 RepID=H6BJZ0_EXODN|nr:15-hydroxyprostaglandin dehydrogenase (NAD) [Exophiala dermatitidis NIH/UT8656]KAJ4509620.1 hypothetical protein HRR75_005746 [Exophiala dermatitidis]EHY52444.1 15-hydroxyprostaglandin dehydrogenase (NAD) [Exophiala dermatitidis NIH/UT8656]KAJ4512550.1 hypothetical protein HRR73_006105 [Exophiala dermatitidis]KAJ4512575.1 hypothetical protein HRR74_006273 [Exophiala dermatitidis]KAJ4542370.1 hypothetical protein HRR77_005577 [Exophiala dermatitidis]
MAVPESDPGTIPFPPSSIIHSPPVPISPSTSTSSTALHANLASKTILITGGASGFGATCFRSWASRGANVIIGDINSTLGTELVTTVRKETGNPNLHFVPLDVTSWPSQVQFFRKAAQLSPHGGIDCVVANAGVADANENREFEAPSRDYGNVDDSIEGDGDAAVPAPPGLRTLDVNLYGVTYTTHLAMWYLPRNPGSAPCDPKASSGSRDRHLLLVSSIAGLSGLPGQPLYAAAKHGVVGLFRTLRLTTPIKHGVRVNMINPYFVDTPILGPLGALVLAGGGMATIESVLEAATRLVADQSIIGRALAIGPKASIEQARAAGLVSDTAEMDRDGQAIWDVYAHDFEQSDLFTRRIIAVTNLITRARGWTGVVGDVAGKASYRFWKVLGY